MFCPKCGSDHVTVQVVTEQKKKGKGVAYWLIVGWWFEPLLWLFLTLPMIIITLCGLRKKTKTVTRTVAVCQNCGNRWTPSGTTIVKKDAEPFANWK